MKRDFILYFVLFCTIILTTGCIDIGAEGQLRININKDNSADINIEFLVNSSALTLFDIDKNPIEEYRKELEKEGFKTSNIVKGEKIGIHASKHVKDIRNEFSTIYRFLTNNEENVNKDILQVKKGLFKDTYILKTSFNIIDSAESKTKEDEWLTNSVLSKIKLKFILDLPFKAKEYNASKVLEEGKVLEWDIIPTMTNPIMVKIQVWNITNIVFTIVAILLILAVAILYIRKSNILKN